MARIDNPQGFAYQQRVLFGPNLKEEEAAHLEIVSSDKHKVD